MKEKKKKTGETKGALGSILFGLGNRWEPREG